MKLIGLLVILGFAAGVFGAHDGKKIKSIFAQKENCKEGDLKANPKDCSTYYVCNYEEWVLMYCPGDLLWNDNAKFCDYSENATCDDRRKIKKVLASQKSKAECNEGDLKANPDDCSSYFVCNYEEWVLMYCPGDLLWNDEAKYCDYSENIICENKLKFITEIVTQEPGDECEEGDYLPNPYDCGSFYFCDNGWLTLENCPNDLLWNEEINTCDFPWNVHCEEISSTDAPTTTETTTLEPTTTTLEPTTTTLEPTTTTTEPTTTTTEPTTTTPEPTTTLEPTTKEPECEDNTFFPNPEDCHTYYVCTHGELIWMECPEDLLWNQEIEKCDYPWNVVCNISTPESIMLKNKDLVKSVVLPKFDCEDGELLPNPEDCSSFFECNNGLLIEIKCPPGLLWNDRTKQCDYPENVVCDVTTTTEVDTTTTEESESAEDLILRSLILHLNEPKADCEDGELLPNPEDCSSFFECNSGLLIEIKCPPGLLWNDKIKQCDYPENVVCDVTTTTEVDTTTTEESTSAEDLILRSYLLHLNKPKADCKDGELLPNPEDCASFFECNGGILIEIKCPPGLLWNDKIKQCDYPENVECDVTTTTDIDTTTTEIDTTTAEPTTIHESVKGYLRV